MSLMSMGGWLAGAAAWETAAAATQVVEPAGAARPGRGGLLSAVVFRMAQKIQGGQSELALFNVQHQTVVLQPLQHLPQVVAVVLNVLAGDE
jgi:hypothetical protein